MYTVYDAAMERIAYIFSEFERVVVSFSGGKDSGVMLNLALKYATENNLLQKLAVYHLDYEAQYQMTTDYVARTFEILPKGVLKLWFCVPVKVPCCTSMFQNYWQPWKLEDKEIWCREMPKGALTENDIPKSQKGLSDYEFNIAVGKELAKTKKTCFLVGIRTQESLHRYTAVNKKTDKNEYKSKKWTTKISENLVNAYPIFDWKTEDIWTANAKYGWDYNELYDLFYLAGISINDMRVASPFISQGQESLKLYKAIDPNNWAKLVGRVNGVNFTAIYGGTTAMGWNSITKPKHFTWKQYMEFLLDTLPEETREIYQRKLETSYAYWLEKGGALPKEVVQELGDNVEFENLGKPKNKINYSRDYEVVKFKEYLDETNIKNPNLLPTYKRMCIAIMKNDTACKTLGFGITKQEMQKRNEIIKKYEDIL